VAGGALKAGTNFARSGWAFALRKTKGHHGIAKYLGGHEVQWLAYGERCKKYHMQFETELNRYLKSMGFPDRNIGREKYREFLASTGRQDKAYKLVQQFAAEFDRKHHTSFLASFLLNFSQGCYDVLQ